MTYEIYRDETTHLWRLDLDGETLAERDTSLEIAIDLAEHLLSDDNNDPLVVEATTAS